MRVLHVLNASGGGASIGALELMRASRLAASGIEHFAVYPGRADPAVGAACTDHRAIPMRWWNIKTSVSPLRRLAIWGREMQITGFGRETRRALVDLIHKWKIDLVHTNTAATVAGALVAAELGLPHVWHIRERIGKNGFMRFRLSDRDLAARIGSLSSAIVPMSQFVGEIFHRYGQGTKTRVVYDGVDLALFAAPEARAAGRELRRAWGVPEGSLLIAKVASVTTRVKRHDVFIRAAGRVARRDPSLRFAIIGPLPKLTSWARRQGIEYYAWLRQLAREEGIEDRLLWTDAVTHVGALMNAIDVLAHACDLEGFGRVAIEAMAAGKPVIGPAAGGFAESVVDGETGRLVPPGDPTALAAGIETLAADPASRARYGRAGRERAARCFSLEAHLQSVQGVYGSVLQRCSRPTSGGVNVRMASSARGEMT